MQKTTAFILTALLAFAPVTAMAETAMPATIDVSADETVKAAPDMAMISAGVMTNNARADIAMQDNAKKMTAVMAALKAAGIADKDVQTAGISIYPQYRYERDEAPQVTGYQASNTVNVVLRDMKNIGPVLDALVSQGVNQLNGPEFSIEKPDALLDDARAKAVQKARARAEVLAKAAGVKVKRVLSISENASFSPPPMRPMMAKASFSSMDAAPTPVAAGEVGLSVTVNLRYEIEQ